MPTARRHAGFYGKPPTVWEDRADVITTTDAALPLSDDESATFWRLHRRLELSKTETAILNDYYEGDQRLIQLGLAIPPELQAFQVILNWPRVTVDGCEERLDLVGFRTGNGAASDYLWDLWQYNDLDEQQSFAHIDALALGRSFLCVGTNAEDPEFPIITIESALEVATERDARTRRVTAALRLYGEQTEAFATQQTADMNPTRATLYLPDVTYWLHLEGGQWKLDGDPDVHGLGVVPVVPMVNRDRATKRRNARVDGVSEMMDVIPVAESASRALTNGQLAQETHAVPHRVLIGATKQDFVRPDGTPTGAFETYMSAITSITNANGKAVQFDATDLSNFETMVNLYAAQASAVARMPIDYFGLHSQNPPSAEGQRAGETRLIKKAERKQSSFGLAWEGAMRVALQYRGMKDSVELRSIEAIWRDAGTPTIAQITDAVVKRRQAGLLDWETAQEKLGETPQQIEVMRKRREADLEFETGLGIQAALVEAANAGEPTALTQAGAETIADTAATQQAALPVGAPGAA